MKNEQYNTIDQVYENVKLARNDPANYFYTAQEVTTIACTAQILDELNKMKETVELIRGLQVYERGNFVNENGEYLDPGDLSNQPIYKPVDPNKNNIYLPSKEVCG